MSDSRSDNQATQTYNPGFGVVLSLREDCGSPITRFFLQQIGLLTHGLGGRGRVTSPLPRCVYVDF